jgi:hypothetical protein
VEVTPALGAHVEYFETPPPEDFFVRTTERSPQALGLNGKTPRPGPAATDPATHDLDGEPTPAPSTGPTARPAGPAPVGPRSRPRLAPPTVEHLIETALIPAPPFWERLPVRLASGALIVVIAGLALLAWRIYRPTRAVSIDAQSTVGPLPAVPSQLDILTSPG